MFTIESGPERSSRIFWVALLSAALLIAGDPAWKNRPIAGWTEEDARQVLTDSPWARTATGAISRLNTEDERREGGSMGQAHGPGFDGIDGKKAKPSLPGTFFSGPPEGMRAATQTLKLQLRWESALPVRAAELKAGVVEPPVLSGDGYSIAVYGVPGGNFREDPKTLGAPLKKEASLRRDGKPDVRPSSVEVFQREDGLVVVYLFPLSAEIGSRDGLVEFRAQIGRVGIVQYFDVGAMRFQGKLEL